MKDIKYRVWSNIENKILSWQDICAVDVVQEVLQGIKCAEFTDTNGNKVYNRYKFIPMEFTGLQDVNGKDIYERYIVELETDNIIGLIEFKDAMFQINLNYKWAIGMRKDLFYYYSNDKIKIVGNLYENPELLELRLEK